MIGGMYFPPTSITNLKLNIMSEIENLKLYSSDYVLVDSENNPLEPIDICYSTDGVRWYFYDSNLDEEEINKQIELLESNGFIEVDYNVKFIRMTDLPKKVQNKYLNHYKGLIR